MAGEGAEGLRLSQGGERSVSDSSWLKIQSPLDQENTRSAAIRYRYPSRNRGYSMPHGRLPTPEFVVFPVAVI